MDIIRGLKEFEQHRSCLTTMDRNRSERDWVELTVIADIKPWGMRHEKREVESETEGGVYVERETNTYLEEREKPSV